MNRTGRSLLSLALGLAAVLALGRITEAQTPFQVKNIDVSILDTHPEELVDVNGTLFFLASFPPVNHTQLWKSDGTAAGTVLVKDLSVYLGSLSVTAYGLTNVNGTLFFVVVDSSSEFGPGIWKSDGTTAGTVVVAVVCPAIAFCSIGGLTNLNGTLYFVPSNPLGVGAELFKTNGTSTSVVKDIWPGQTGSLPQNLTNVNGTLFFSANDGTLGRELWKSDGTAAGTVLVKDITPGSPSSNFKSLTDVNGTLFFNAGEMLWKSDGTTAGTVIVSPAPYSPDDMENLNGTVFFRASDPANGEELWKSDGSPGGTVLVKDLSPGTGSSHPHSLTRANGTLFFIADDGINGDELWKSDGTPGGTVLVRDILPGAGSANIDLVTSVNGTLFFTADDGITGTELWKSDGTAAGTVLVKDILAGGSSEPYGLVAVGATLFFAANDGATGFELWKSDGTAGGTAEVVDLSPSGSDSSDPSDLVDLNGTVLFQADDGVFGPELWKSDGTAAGTTIVKDISPQGPGSSPSLLTRVNGSVFFSASDGVNGTELWKTDGTTAGTVMVKDINPGGASSFIELAEAGGTVFFSVFFPGVNGVDLWKSDGTEAGTVLLKHFAGITQAGSHLTNMNGTLFFSAEESALGYELWKSDGTTAGTVLVKDICPGFGSAYPAELTNVNGTLFFSARDCSLDTGLWKSDGTEAGTVLVKNIDPARLTDVSGTLFFAASDGVTGYELWKSDGTAAGTVLVKDINPGSADSIPRSLTNVNGTLFFTASSGGTGTHLWKSDGTAAGTVLVKDIFPGSDPNFDFLTNVNGTLFFTPYDAVHGRELWKSDGTAAGTVVLGDIAAGAASSNPSELTLSGLNLYFAADDHVTGRELWGAVVAVPSISAGDCTITEGDTGQVDCAFTVLLSAPSIQTVIVSFATVEGTATSGVDYLGGSGTLTFPPGTLMQTVSVGIIGDFMDEPDETFSLNLSSPVNATIADGQGQGTILDNDPPPSLSIGDCAVVEGNAGSVPCGFTVSLDAASGFTASVAYAIADGTAVAGSDYVAASGTVTFAPGVTTQPVAVSVLGDTAVEVDETFFVNLTAPVNAALADAQGVGTIGDDDALSLSSNELHHGSMQRADLQTRPDLYRIGQKPYSSYEVVIDETSGDIVPVTLERLAGDNLNVLQTASPIAVGDSVSLRWENTTSLTVVNQHLRVDGLCATPCGADDVYRLRALETTYSIPRFNNSGTQLTVLLLQNPGSYAVTGHVWFWSTSGTLLTTEAFSLPPKQTLVLNTATVAGLAGQGGAITISHDGRYGDLTGKTVALEPSSGFSFDSPMAPRVN